MPTGSSSRSFTLLKKWTISRKESSPHRPSTATPSLPTQVSTNPDTRPSTNAASVASEIPIEHPAARADDVSLSAIPETVSEQPPASPGLQSSCTSSTTSATPPPHTPEPSSPNTQTVIAGSGASFGPSFSPSNTAVSQRRPPSASLPATPPHPTSFTPKSFTSTSNVAQADTSSRRFSPLSAPTDIDGLIHNLERRQAGHAAQKEVLVRHLQKHWRIFEDMKAELITTEKALQADMQALGDLLAVKRTMELEIKSGERDEGEGDLEYKGHLDYLSDSDSVLGSL